MFSVENISYQYQGNEGEIFALKDVSLQIDVGQWWAIVGSNGSGKSTLARHLNGLLLPSAGRVLTAGLDTREPQNLPAVHRQVGFVFQNPDNQMVGNTVEEDVAFGPENMGMPREEIRRQHRLIFRRLRNAARIYWKKRRENCAIPCLAWK